MMLYLWNETKVDFLRGNDIDPDCSNSDVLAYADPEEAQRVLTTYTEEYAAYGLKFDIKITADYPMCNAKRIERYLLEHPMEIKTEYITAHIANDDIIRVPGGSI